MKAWTRANANGSDIVCPFCYVGKHALAQALQGFEHADEVQVLGHSFELDPTADNTPQRPLDKLLAAKYGISRAQAADQCDDLAATAAGLGLTFNWREAQYSGTRDAHRLLTLAQTVGKRDEAEERFMRAYFTEGQCPGDHDVLRRLCAEVGLDAERVDEVLFSDEFTDEVRDSERRAAHRGARGVPFFLIDDQYTFSGALPVPAMRNALQRAWALTHEQLTTIDVGVGGDVCATDGCSPQG